MDIIKMVRPLLKALKLGEVKTKLGLSESRRLQISLTKVFEKLEIELDTFLALFAKAPYLTIFKIINDLALADWDEKQDKPGEILEELLDVLTDVFQTEQPLKDLQWLELLDRIADFEEEVNKKLKENFTEPGSTTSETPISE